MKKILFVVILILASLAGFSQNDQPLPAYGYEADRLRVLKSLQIPHFTDPKTQRKDSLRAQIGYKVGDTSALWLYSPETLGWYRIKAGPSGSVDSVTARNDSLFYYAAGSEFFVTQLPLAAASSNAQKALYFPGGTTYSNMCHGYYFVEEHEFGTGSFEAWIRPLGSGYVISDGYGGVHDWLVGVSAVNDSMFQIGGNTWYGGTNTGLLSYDFIKKGTAHHIAVALVSGYLVTYIDGVPSWRTAWSYGRKNAASSGCGALFIGGSDHLNYKGTIFRVKMFEGNTPFAVEATMYAQQTFRSDDPYLSFLADYTSGHPVAEDQSLGLFGMRHNGFPQQGAAIYVNPPIQPMDSIPHYINDSIYKSPYSGAISSAPGGAKVYDFFERTDQVPAFDTPPNIDSTQGGTLGKKKYTYGNGGWTSGVFAGILNAYCYFSYLGGGKNFVYVTGDSNDQDIRVTIKTGAGSTNVSVFARYTDDNNQIWATMDGTAVNLYKVVGGSFSSLGSFTLPSVASELKLVVSGSNATVYCDGVSRITSSSVGDLPSSNKSGFGTASVYTRIKKFEIY